MLCSGAPALAILSDVCGRRGTIDVHARVGGPRLPATTSRTPVSSGKSTHARTPGQAYLQFSFSAFLRLGWSEA